MKRLLLLLIAIGLAHILEAQVKSPVVLGNASGNKVSGKITYTYNIGSPIPYMYSGGAANKLQVGFPYNVLYKGDTFSSPLFVSKGYYPDHVQLRWTIGGNEDMIDHFEVYRRKLGTTEYILAEFIDKSLRKWDDRFSEANVIYEYRLDAVGIIGERRVGYTHLEGVGFRAPIGTVVGRVSYPDGIGVPGVSVTAGSTDIVPVSSILLANNSYIEIPQSTAQNFSNGFTFQAYLKFKTNAAAGIFNKAGNFDLSYDGTKFIFTVGSSSVSLNYAVPTDAFMHITAAYQSDSLKLYIPAKVTNDKGQLVDQLLSAAVKASVSLTANTNSLYIGRGASSYFNGNVDEIRMWQKGLTKADVMHDFNRYISGKETGIYAYIRMNEGFGDHVYDISKVDPNFNENHGVFVGSSVTWSNVTPTLDQLGNKGISDGEGNYIISGIPFIADGSSYKLVPMMAPHEFQPAYKILFISESSAVFNNIDFTDISKVNVTLNATYNTGTGFPVSDVLIKLDGNYMTDANSQLVKTGENGKVTLSVPIGSHYLTFEKQGHVFENPNFPAKDAEGNVMKYYFIENIPELRLSDITRVTLAGKIVGGPVEFAKVLGSKINPAKNNIGVVTVSLTTERGYDLDADATPKNISVTSDAETGEYSIEVIPEKFKPSSQTAISNVHYIFNTDKDLALIDMSNQFFKFSEVDSIFTKDNLGKKVFNRVDTVSTYNKRKDWIYRTQPSLEMQNASGGKVISETSIVYKEGASSVTIATASETGGNIVYPFGKPIFNFANDYAAKFLAFEEYINHDKPTDNVDRVPVTDGVLLINNDLALTDKQIQGGFNDQGIANYSFTADFPNIASPYTRIMNITLKTPSANIQLPQLEAYILGGKPTGNNFVTTGPTEVDFILRDPPGSNSSSTLEKGFTSSKSASKTIANGEEGESQFALQMGVKAETVAGVGLAVVSDFETDNFIGVKLENSYNKEGEFQTTSSLTFGESFSTSAEPDFVGAEGDVFIGHSSNIVYGISRIVKILPKAEIPAGMPEISNSGTYSISMEDGLRVNPEFGTMFVYSQKVIEEEMIPHLEKLRNIFLEKPLYTKVLTDITDRKYGTNNDDKATWKTAASTDPYHGPSYIFDTSGSVDPLKPLIDSVRFYNNQIISWKSKLELNERQKLRGIPDSRNKNISFSVGSSYSSYIESEYDSVHNESSEFTIAPGVATSLGFSLNKTGIRVDLSQKYTHSESDSKGNGSTITKNVGFTLEDNDANNYFTVDVFRCASGNGPIFKTRGGQSSCPYEGELKTKYYNQGSETLSFATMKIDGPQLACKDPVSPITPETSPAYFTFQLSNISEAEKDNWYTIGIDVASNPNGAKVMMDGASISEGVAVFVPYGQTVTKTIEVIKGRPDVNTYENLSIYLSSQCDDNISVSVPISAYFQTACTPVEFTLPFDKWVINSNDNDQMLVKIGGYNLAHNGFEDIQFQYKSSTSSMWTTARIFTNDAAHANDDNTTYINNSASIQYTWDMKSLPDREYDIRLISHCADGTLNYSKTLSGMLDGQRPQVFGTPLPADGILDISDQISIQFNEPIEQGLLIPANFQLTGTISQGDLQHDSYVRLNGTSDQLSIPEGISLNSKSFTIEFWMRPDSYSNSVIFAQGNDPSVNLEIGLKETFNTYMKIAGLNFEAALKFSPTVPETAWQHMAYTFDSETGDVFIYQNDKIIFEARSTKVNYKNLGPILIGKSAVSNASFFAGSFHELRIWNKSLSLGDVYANQYKLLSGSEIGLYGYWPINEAFGTLAEDKAANRHMTVSAPWEVYPGGSSWNFANANFLKFFTGYFAIIPEMDYTIEFWFRANNPSGNACLFSNQKGDGNEGIGMKDKALSITATPEGKILINSNGNVFEAVTTDYFDNTWHHFALVVKRRGNVASYVDGNLQNEKENSFVGGVAGGEMYLGVRKWKNTIDEGEDMYFDGKIDEFRIWNLSKTADQIILDRNSKLKGTEIGLMAYFPLERYTESYGVFSQVATLDNLMSDVNVQPLVPKSGNTFSTDAPNMKDVRPIQAIAYNFVSSTDKIIFNPEEYLLPQLEKNIIEITVKGIEDKYGNRLASPVKWTAYVHRNQVRWEEERRTLSKLINQTLTFTSSIKNTGGVQVGFTITNLPAWISVSPSSGVINPESTREITFTVNPALNIGTYNEDIILRTENGFDEKLPLTVHVSKTPPTWNVNPSQFEHTMNIVGSVKVEGVLSTDVSDMVAAFKFGTDSIRGVANIRYLKELDTYQVFLNVYGNNTGEKLVFRVWDASAGQILDEVLPDNITFIPNDVKGTTLAPIIFTAVNSFRTYLPLAKGWNWVSFNKISKVQNNLNAFMSSLESKATDQIKTHGGGFNNYDPLLGWAFGGIDAISNSSMYQIKVSQADTLIYNGSYVEPESFPIALATGWNHVSYIPDFLMDVNEALRLYSASDAEIIKSQYAFAMYDPRVGWLGTLDVMKPGFGYMIKTNKTATLKYPNTTLLKDATISMKVNPPLGWESDYSHYEGNMSVLARLETGNVQDITINDQMVLGAFIDNKCHGYTSPITNSEIDYSPFFLNVSSYNNSQLVKFMLYDGKTGKTYQILETKPYLENAVYGSTQKPIILTIAGQVTGIISPNRSEAFVRCYPNPFNDLVSIEYRHLGGELKIDVLDQLGRTINHVFDGIPDAGIGSVAWDGTSENGKVVAAGLYYIRVSSGQTVGTIKITKNR
ncbi:MAG: hypothetical protein JZU47_18295 [Prolixibacteraceae bacterium]|nr:hypothetical protein [Prolixibacteraceae bacterium]